MGHHPGPAADLSAAETQADRYADSLTPAQQRASWQAKLPFRYTSDGGETRFRNTLDPDSRTRRVFSFHQPRTFARWMRQAGEERAALTYRARLRTRMPELDATGLRPAQIDAVWGVEESLAAGRGQAGLGQPRALIQMATSAGKTYTAVTFSYRLLGGGADLAVRRRAVGRGSGYRSARACGHASGPESAGHARVAR